eukprot:Seg425.4 transcript_id=Seg425.4/GoldUCD/mRNA.D3Y31 product="Gamma-aminobutyric acid receptor subunit rho-1" protein_id=Seg425.4/GoldUCD/D3Y31
MISAMERIMMLMFLIFTMLDGKSSSVLASASSVSAQLTNATKNYDMRVRPYADSARLNITVQLGVIGLGPVDETSLTLGMDFYLRHWWKDPRLNFGSEVFNYNGDPSDMIWVPDTFFPNAVEAKSHKTLTTNTRTKFGPYGQVYVSTRMTLKTFCKMRLERYPFDIQTCRVQLESYSYTGRELRLSWRPKGPQVEYLEDHVQLSGYELVNIKGVTKNVHYITNETFQALEAEVKVKRTFTYHLYSGYMPSCLLVVLTWGTFWIPARAVPARVTLIVTNFLTTIFVIQQEGLKIIRVDYTTAVQIFLVVNLFFVLLSMVEYLVVLNVRSCHKEERKLTVISNGLAQGVAVGNLGTDEDKNGNDNLSTLESQTKKQKRAFVLEDAHIVDYYSRFIVPLIYIIFLLTYVLYYALQKE